MKIGFPVEIDTVENRTAVTPESVKKILKLGHAVMVESQAGVRAGFSDADYQAAGASISPTAEALWQDADLIAKVQPATSR